MFFEGVDILGCGERYIDIYLSIIRCVGGFFVKVSVFVHLLNLGLVVLGVVSAVIFG